MKTISNIMQLWRFYWRTEKKQYLRLFLTIFAIFLVKVAVLDFLLVRISADAYDYSHNALQHQIYWVAILILISYLFEAVHHKQRAINYLGLPANNSEKFISRFIWGIVGVPILVHLAMTTAVVIVTLFLGTMDSLAGHQPEWMKIFVYYYNDYTLEEMLYTCSRPFGLYIYGLFQGYMFLLSFLSFFIWFGTAFRRAGWVYAIITIFILLALFVFILDFMGILNQPATSTARRIFFYGIIFLSIPFTLLAYHSFCRSQIVNHKFFTL